MSWKREKLRQLNPKLFQQLTVKPVSRHEHVITFLCQVLVWDRERFSIRASTTSHKRPRFQVHKVALGEAFGGGLFHFLHTFTPARLTLASVDGSHVGAHICFLYSQADKAAHSQPLSYQTDTAGKGCGCREVTISLCEEIITHKHIHTHTYAVKLMCEGQGGFPVCCWGRLLHSFGFFRPVLTLAPDVDSLLVKLKLCDFFFILKSGFTVSTFWFIFVSYLQIQAKVANLI